VKDLRLLFGFFGRNFEARIIQEPMDKIPFAFSIHPGEILLTEFMEPLGLSAYRLAKELHISAPMVNDLVRGKRGITADTALRLARYFGNSAQFWIGLQSGHDLWVVSRNKSVNKVKPRQVAA
jgi:addiction module HigA family antidote